MKDSERLDLAIQFIKEVSRHTICVDTQINAQKVLKILNDGRVKKE